MDLPFTPDEFFTVFEQYNTAVWPMQIVLNLLGISAIYFAVKRVTVSDKIIALILGVLWIWTGIAYHFSFFAVINPAANVFALLCIIQALLFLWFGVFKSRISVAFHPSVYGLMGGVLLLYALLVYPLLGYAFGHLFPRAPSFGLPCPTTMFTFGLLFWADRTLPKVILILPLLWSIIGSSAAFTLGVHEDIGLLISGVAGLAMLVFRSGTGPALQA